jgi:hypothetical protein
MNYEISISAILVPLLAGGCTLLGILLQRKTEKIKIIESQLADKKHKVYDSLFGLFFEIINNITDNEDGLPPDYKQRMLNIKKDLFIYGSDEIFYQFSKWIVKTSNTNTPGENLKHMKSFVELFVLIRKDMGNKNSKINIDDFMVFIIQNPETYQNFKKTNNW